MSGRALLSAHSVTSLDVVHHADALTWLRGAPSNWLNVALPPYCGIINLCRSMEDNMTRDEKGRFVKGQRVSPKTEFKKGQHWRDPKPYWDQDWLHAEYVEKGRSAGDIAKQFGVKDANILYFLRKFNISRRTVSEARALKHWGLAGEMNGMYGRTGELNARWRGGVSPERQALYSSHEWSKAVVKVWARDKATCQRCGKTRAEVEVMHVHHIVSFAVKELRADPDNLMLLCRECHWWVHSSENVNGEFMADV